MSRHTRWLAPETEPKRLPQGYLCIARVENIGTGKPRNFPNKTTVPLKSTEKERYDYCAVLKEYGWRKEDGKVEDRYELEILRNVVHAGRGEPESIKMATFRFGSDVRVEVSSKVRHPVIQC